MGHYADVLAALEDLERKGHVIKVRDSAGNIVLQNGEPLWELTSWSRAQSTIHFLSRYRLKIWVCRASQAAPAYKPRVNRGEGGSDVQSWWFVVSVWVWCLQLACFASCRSAADRYDPSRHACRSRQRRRDARGW